MTHHLGLSANHNKQGLEVNGTRVAANMHFALPKDNTKTQFNRINYKCKEVKFREIFLKKRKYLDIFCKSE